MRDSPKRIIYSYKGKSDLRELELDPNGELAIPSVGSTIVRDGKEWTVIRVLHQTDSSNPDKLAVVYVILSDGSDE